MHRFTLATCAALVVGAGLLLSASARAQPEQPEAPSSEPPPIEAPAPTHAFTLPEALAFAHAHQPAILTALARIAAAQQAAKIPSAQWLPTFAVAAQGFAGTDNNNTATYVDPPFMDVPRVGGTQANAPSSWAPYPSTFAAAGVRQELFDFGRIAAARAAADDQVVATKHSADAERLDIDFGVQEAFYSVFAARAIIKASDDAYLRAKAHRDLAKAGVASGLRSPIELTRAEADLARFDVGRIRARGALVVAQAVLAAAIGSPEPTVDVAGEAPPPGPMPTLREAVQLASERDPLLQRALAELKAAEDRTTAIGAELRPNLALTGTLSGRAGGADGPAGTSQPAGAGFVPDIPNWDVGLILTWPLFDGTVAARRDAAKSTEQVKREEIDVARLRIVARVNETFVKVQVARDALVALQRSMVAAEANYAQADARFRAGLGTAVELADAEAVRTDAEIAFAVGQFDLAQARAAFGRAIAEGL